MTINNDPDSGILSADEKNTAMLLHLSTFLKFFFPFANFIAPVLIWSFNKEKAFVDEHGRQALNFQLSLLIYYLVLGMALLVFALLFGSDLLHLLEDLDHTSQHMASITYSNLTGFLMIFGLAILLCLTLLVFQIYAVVNAAIYASRGHLYYYPLCIPFIKSLKK